MEVFFAERLPVVFGFRLMVRRAAGYLANLRAGAIHPAASVGCVAAFFFESVFGGARSLLLWLQLRIVPVRPSQLSGSANGTVFAAAFGDVASRFI